MDRRERLNSPQAAIKVALDALQADIWTAMPGIVVSYDAGAQTVNVQVAIQAQQQAQDGSWSQITIAAIPDVPVEWPGGDDAVLTFPLKPGNEGLLVFCSRCINAWWSQGGIQPQEELRMHNLSDAVFIPRLHSKAQKLNPAPSTTTTQLRSNDGTTIIELDAANKKLNLTAPGGITMNGVMIDAGGNISAPAALRLGGSIQSEPGDTYTGDIITTGNVIARSGAGQVGLATHTHRQPNDSHGDTEAATDAPTGGT